MPIDSSVAELITAQLFVLVQEAPDPIYFYINSTGIAVSDQLQSGGCAVRWLWSASLRWQDCCVLVWQWHCWLPLAT